MPRNPVSGQYAPRKGGPEPTHQEVSVRGPFSGFQTDIDHYHPQTLVVAKDVQNIDFINGNLQTRPGLEEVVRAENIPFNTDLDTGPDFDTCAGGQTSGGAVLFSPNIYFVVSEPAQDNIYNTSWRLFMVGQYYIYCAVLQSGAQLFDRFIDPTLITWEKYNKILTDSATTVNPAGALDAQLTDADIAKYRIITYSGGSDSYFKLQPDGAVGGSTNRWVKISGVVAIPASNLHLDFDAQYQGQNGVQRVGQICCPVVDRQIDVREREEAPIGVDATQVLGVDDQVTYYISGSPGGTLFQPFSQLNATFYQTADDFVHYVADCSVWYGDRLLLGTARSYEDIHPDTGAALANGKNNFTDSYRKHDGRLAYSSSRDPRVFDFSDDRTAGFRDLTGGRIRDLFILRDICFAVTDTEIHGIMRTGNPFSPFRTRKVISNRKFTVRSKARVVDGLYAYIACPDGLYRFDGSTLQPVANQISEHYRGMYGLVQPNDGVIGDSQIGRQLSTPNILYYDDNRSRVFFAPRNTNDEVIVHEVRGGFWSKYRFGDGADAAGINDTIPVLGLADWSTSTVDFSSVRKGAKQEVECLLFTTDKEGDWSNILWCLRRSRITDEVASPENEIDDFWESEEFDVTGESRTKKTAARIRFAFQFTTTATNRISVSLYADGGVTPSYTGNIDFAAPAPSEIGKTTDAWLTIPGGVTANTFRIFWRGLDPQRRIIKEIGMTFKERQEQRQA